MLVCSLPQGVGSVAGIYPRAECYAPDRRWQCGRLDAPPLPAGYSAANFGAVGGRAVPRQCEISSSARLLVRGPQPPTPITTTAIAPATNRNTAGTPNWPRSQAMMKPV